MQVMQTVKDNPWIVLFGSSGTVISLVVALFAIDSRYAHAYDVEKNYQQLQQSVQQTSTTLRKQMLEDKLFELDIKREQSPNQRLSPTDSALAARYKRQLEEIIEKEKKDK